MAEIPVSQSVCFVICFFKHKFSHYLSEMSEENHKHFKLWWLLFKLIFEPGTCQIPVWIQCSTLALSSRFYIVLRKDAMLSFSLAAYVHFYLFMCIVSNRFDMQS